jgi:lipid A 3-O-deacylase
VTQIGITPVLRVWPGSSPSTWFGEIGVGANVIAPLYRGNHRHFATAFDFGDHVAWGWQFDDRRETEVTLRLQHFSNAGIKRPNPGENFWQVRISWKLD